MSTNTISATEPLRKQTEILSTEELLAAQKAIIHLLQSKEKELDAIRISPIPLMEKWQKFLHIILPSQIEVIKTYGFREDQEGLTRFNAQYIQACLYDPIIRELNQKKWLFLFEKAFGVTEFKEISLEDARFLISDIVEDMTSESFLTQIDQMIEKLGEDASLVEKRKELLTILFPLHLSVMEKHGFIGEMGYIQAQRAIMDYYSDPFISENASYAQQIVFKRAHLL